MSPAPSAAEPQDERAKFEAWLVTAGGWLAVPKKYNSGAYINGQAQARWIGWQACAASQQVPEPQTLPVKDFETQGMGGAAIQALHDLGHTYEGGAWHPPAPLAQQVPEPQPAGVVEALRPIIDKFPELNPSNYDHDDACALNAWGVELVLAWNAAIAAAEAAQAGSAPQEPDEASMYRFIRSLHWHDSPMAVVMNPKEAVKLGHWCPFGDLLDAEVKRLMKEKT